MTQDLKPWLASYRENGIPATIDPDAHPSVVHLMEQAMRRHGDKVAFRSLGRTLTYAEVERRSGAFAAWLQQALGIRKGDRIALMLPNILAFPIATLGIARAGAVQVNVNPLYTPRELEHQLNDAGAEVIVVFAGSTAALAEVLPRTGIRTVITVDLGDGAGTSSSSSLSCVGPEKAICFAEALLIGARLPRAPVRLCGADTLFLQYTGGTSGLSKGAVLSHRNLVANIEQFKAMNAGALRPGEEVVVTAIPLYHIFALMVNFLAYFSIGSENWLVPNPRDLDAFIDVLKHAEPTVFVGVNTMYAGLIQHPRIGEVGFGRLRLSIGGGAAIVRVVSDQWQALTGSFIREGYGLTETSPVVSFNPLSVRSFGGSTGLPMPGTDIRIVDEDGALVGIGEAGEVLVKGPQLMQGYWRQPAANAEAFTADGYFRTGDIGVIDPDGFLKIVDRKKDMVIVSGFNVYPNEVEAVASSFAGVAECACVGVPDLKSGEALALYVVQAPGSLLSEAALLAHCRTLLTAYKVPRIVHIVGRLPKSTVGKILRRELRIDPAAVKRLDG